MAAEILHLPSTPLCPLPSHAADFQLELPEPIMQALYKEAMLMSKIRHLNVRGRAGGPQ